MGGACSTNGKKRNTYGLLVGKRPLRRPRRSGWIIHVLGWILERWDGVMLTALVWLRIWTGGGLLWIRCWIFGFHKLLGSYRVASQLVASRVVLSSTELVSYVLFMGVELGFSYWEKNAEEMWLRAGHWRRCLDIRQSRKTAGEYWAEMLRNIDCS
jgi:hypothetical protein